MERFNAFMAALALRLSEVFCIHSFFYSPRKRQRECSRCGRIEYHEKLHYGKFMRLSNRWGA